MAFPLNFIKLFGLKLRVSLCIALIFSKLTNQLSNSQYEGVITLLPEPGNTKLSASNYRPIAFLNCDYKIISKVITNKINSILNNLTEKEQNNLMKARNIGLTFVYYFISLITQTTKKCQALYF